MPQTKKSQRGIDYEPKRLPNLHADFINPLPFGRGIWLQHKSCFGVPMKIIDRIEKAISSNCRPIMFAVLLDCLTAIEEQQKRIDELESKVTDLSKNLKDRELAVLVRQERIDAVEQTLAELNEASEALHHRWHIFNEQTDLREAEGIDLAIKDIKQALKGGDE